MKIFIVTIIFFITGCGKQSSSNMQDGPAELSAKPNVASTPTPSPSPTPTPTPLPPPPVPTPTPSYSKLNMRDYLEDFEEAKEIYYSELALYYENILPFQDIGSEISIRQASGLVLNGKFSDIRNDKVTIDTFSGEKEVALSEIDSFSRFSLDRKFRDILINYEAALKAFEDVSQNYEIEKLKLSDAQRAGSGDPKVLAEIATNSDIQIRFFITGLLAKQGNTQAKRELAIMYLQGNGVTPNQAIFKNLMSQASDEGDPLAAELLSKYEESIKQQQQNQEPVEKKTVQYTYKTFSCRSCNGRGYNDGRFKRGDGSYAKMRCNQCSGTGSIRKRVVVQPDRKGGMDPGVAKLMDVVNQSKIRSFPSPEAAQRYADSQNAHNKGSMDAVREMSTMGNFEATVSGSYLVRWRVKKDTQKPGYWKVVPMSRDQNTGLYDAIDDTTFE